MRFYKIIKLTLKKQNIMNCPKCKNPIEDNAAFCQWCGAVVDNSAIENQENDFDREIISLLKQKQKRQAVKLYKEKTGEKLLNSIDYVARLDFFVSHAYASDSVWQKSVYNIPVINKCVSWISILYIGRWLLFLFLIYSTLQCISATIIILVESFSKNYEYLYLYSLIPFVFAIIFIVLAIKVKKRINRIIL